MFEQAIPPSDGDESDEEMFQHMLVGNHLRKVPDAAYQPPSLNAEYSHNFQVIFPLHQVNLLYLLTKLYSILLGFTPFNQKQFNLQSNIIFLFQVLKLKFLRHLRHNHPLSLHHLHAMYIHL